MATWRRASASTRRRSARTSRLLGPRVVGMDLRHLPPLGDRVRRSRRSPTTRALSETIVRVVSTDPAGLGVEHLSAGDLAMIYTAGLAMLDVRTGRHRSRRGVWVIAETIYGEPASASAGRGLEPVPSALQDAQPARTGRASLYSRAWNAGLSSGTSSRSRLIQTHRGWEVDAGPVGPEGNLRTYLLTNIRDVQVLDETFEPADGRRAAAAQAARDHHGADGIAQDARWAADMYAERLDVVIEDEEMARGRSRAAAACRTTGRPDHARQRTRDEAPGAGASVPGSNRPRWGSSRAPLPRP